MTRASAIALVLVASVVSVACAALAPEAMPFEDLSHAYRDRQRVVLEARWSADIALLSTIIAGPQRPKDLDIAATELERMAVDARALASKRRQQESLP